MTVTQSRLDDLAARDIRSDLDTWPSIARRIRARQRRRVQLRATAVLAIAVVLVAASVQSIGNPQSVSADMVLDRAGAATDGAVTTVRTFHSVSTTTFTPAEGVPGGPQIQHEETWFGGPDRMRQETQTPEWSTVTVRGPSETWWAVTRAGQTYYAPANGVRFSDTARLNPLAPENANIASVLAFLHQRGCGSAQLKPEAVVAGRQTYVVSVPHTLNEACVDPLQAIAAPSPAASVDPSAKATMGALEAAKKATAVAAGGLPEKARANLSASPVPSAVIGKAEVPEQEFARRLSSTVVDTFWIDKQTFVPLRAEQTNGIKGSSVYLVSSVTYDLSLPESTFEYVPPPGAHRLNDPGAIKEALAATLR